MSLNKDTIAVLDFGGQYAHLIANRVRRLGVYSEILDAETKAKELKKYKGIILSGGPQSVYEQKSPKCDPALFRLGVPVLGICYGHQLTQHILGGKVVPGKTREYGLAELTVKKSTGILKGLPKKSRIWMSHFDMVGKLAPGFEIIGITDDCPTAALADEKRKIYGIQFHAEVTHTENGMKILDNFLNICEMKREWSIEKFMEEEIKSIQKKIGDQKVFLLVSGGVDSTVCFTLLEKALSKKRVYGLLVDTGLMRLGEAQKVKKALSGIGFDNLHVADKSEVFYKALKGVAHPELKRKIIGDMFWKVKEDMVEELKLNPKEWIMGQGTIYPDTIETGGTKHADKIKTHHNRVDLVQTMIREGKVIEPLAQLYKDEVRALGEKLGLPKEFVWRQPFPGPGLGVRILCVDDVEAENKVEFTALNKKIEDFIKQKFSEKLNAKVLPIRSVGVQGDARTYRHPVALFTKIKDWGRLEELSTAITNNFPEVNRVILALKGDSGDFKLKPCDLSPERVSLLQIVDDGVTKVMAEAPKSYDIWQFPVVLAPVSTETGKESIVLRPIVSTEAMTASFARIDRRVVEQIVERIDEPSISHIFYDLTHKPPGTIEWE
jgi:GMP synthase (glutamine-hydrolysing)